jgi:hypothetical protein
VFLAVLLFATSVLGAKVEFYAKGPTWAATMLDSRVALQAAQLPEEARKAAASRLWFQVQVDFPVQWDWMFQDAGPECWHGFFAPIDTDLPWDQILSQVLAELGDAGKPLRQELQGLRQAKPASRARWLYLYVRACEQRRQQRLRTVLTQTPRIIFTKHHTVLPSFFAYTEGQSDAQNERVFLPRSELCLLEMDGLYGKVHTLVSDPTGAIRDPAVSWDGQKVLFAWKKLLDDDDYHLYEWNVGSNSTRQITSGLGFADYEPAWLPNGDIIFSSTRCVQTVDCFWTEVSNLYTCDANGRFLRRLGFDQVHTVYPQVLEDGRVIYTRWDYNDRGQIFPQPLFQMFPDGTGQTEFYGNNSWFPTTIAHARGIPGTDKVLAVLCGHHTPQAGKLAVIDPALGRQENSGVQLVAPKRATPAERIDTYGQVGELWQYPYPLNERECLVTYAPLGWAQPQRRGSDADFGIYWMDFDGRRELLAWDAKLPCSQPVPLAPRPRPHVWANRVDYSKNMGVYYVQDVYAGPGLAGIPRGTIKKLRVVTLDFRAAGIGQNGSVGPGGSALCSTPISIGNGAWDVKTVLGDATVYEDGSAMFQVPARKPVYFQALDERGFAVQTMRSWSTLQPNEFFGCIGCHESKNSAPPTQNYGFSLAMKAGAKTLAPFYGPARGFSFPSEIQPILDRHCIRCHKDRAPIQRMLESGKPILSSTRPAQTPSQSLPGGTHALGTNVASTLAFSLLGQETEDRTAKRMWSDAYLVLTQAGPNKSLPPGDDLHGDNNGRVVNWISAQSVPTPLSPYSAGAARSELMTLLEKGHQGVRLSREEWEKLACWIDLLVPYCGDYTEANAWTHPEMRKYRRYADKRRWEAEAEEEYIRALLPPEDRPQDSRRPRGPGRPMFMDSRP